MNTVKRGVFTGAAAFGFLKAWNGNRKANRAIRRKRKGKSLTVDEETLVAEQTSTVTLPSGETIQRAEPMIPARTSTKVAVGTGAIAAFPAVELLQWVQSIEFSTPWLEGATNSDYFIFYGSLVISWAIARLTKSPIAKQAV